MIYVCLHSSECTWRNVTVHLESTLYCLMIYVCLHSSECTWRNVTVHLESTLYCLMIYVCLHSSESTWRNVTVHLESTLYSRLSLKISKKKDITRINPKQTLSLPLQIDNSLVNMQHSRMLKDLVHHFPPNIK